MLGIQNGVISDNHPSFLGTFQFGFLPCIMDVDWMSHVMRFNFFSLVNMILQIGDRLMSWLASIVEDNIRLLRIHWLLTWQLFSFNIATLFPNQFFVCKRKKVWISEKVWNFKKSLGFEEVWILKRFRFKKRLNLKTKFGFQKRFRF